MAKINVQPGICGLVSDIEVTSDDGMTAQINVETQCPHIKTMAEQVPSVDGYTECFTKYGDGAIALAAKAHCQHGACPVPTAILKGVEVACSLALPKDVTISIEK
ncbi:MAG: hypothetical protein HN948_10425 [Clostridia bacterium]|jgi:hypothetical protein|nr:hypothetical protein [Clostridia bacterium]MBT7123410.1 hypothetical protein [Clostridia bacterium]